MMGPRAVALGSGVAVAALAVMTCTGGGSATPPPSASDAGEVGDASDGVLDCVGVLLVPRLRGNTFANVRRYGKENVALRESTRLAELSEQDLRAFCDWEACVRTNGYNHACILTDGGVERCRVCSDAGDCGGFPRSREECVARARAPGRGTCHVGLLEECLIQRGVRGFGDSRVTRTCWMSREACGGRKPESLVDEARAAQKETDQVTVAAISREVDLAAELEPDSADGGVVELWRKTLSEWQGGLPTEVSDAGDFDMPE
jgi:hypothetical protein